MIPDWVVSKRRIFHDIWSFERFDEAAESFKEACSRRLKGLTPFWFPGWYVCISVELFIIQTSRSLEAKEKHKLVCEVHLLVFDEIDR